MKNALLSPAGESPSDRAAVEVDDRRWLRYMKMITVEPSMFLYMLAFMLTSVVEQAFFVHKACTVDMKYSEEICSNLTGNSTENTNVQLVVSTFHQWNDIASQIIPICLALFIGSWSDRRGRKLLLLLGLLGKLWYSVWIVINATQDSWPLNTVVWSASLPSGLTGADVAIFAACFSYLCDVTNEQERTMRATILDVTYLVSIPVGVAIGNFLFHSVVNKSYAIMFSINACLLLLAFLYSLIRLEWTTSPQQRVLVPGCCNSNPDDPNVILDFFDKDHLIKSVKTIVRRRPLYGRLFVSLLILSLGLYTFQRDERQMSYLYTVYKFNWDVNAFSNFRTFQSALYVVGTLLCIPMMSRWMRLSDTTMIMIGTTSHAIARVIFALAEKSYLFYVGSALSSLGPVVAPVIRSMASKIVPMNERGKMLAVLSVADTAVPLFSGIVYTQVYNRTLSYYPSGIFWITVATQMAVFLAAVLIKILTRGHTIDECARSFSSEDS